MLGKVLISLAFIIGGLAYMLYMPLSPDVKEPWKIQIFGGIFGFAFLLGPIGEMVGFGTSINITRSMIDATLTVASPTVDPRLVEREDTIFNGVPVRIYRPKSILKSQSPVAAMVYFHGGGFIFGSVVSHDLLTAHYAVEANIVVVSVEYRMAPEHPYPVPVEDCRTAVEYLINNAARYNVDPNRVAVGGDSAGGNLAAVVSLMLRNTQFRPMPKAQVLLYPVLQFLDVNTPSYFRALRVFNNTDILKMMVQLYLKLPKHYAEAFTKNRHVTPALRKKYGVYIKPDMLPKDFIPPDYKPTDPNNWGKTVPEEVGKKFVHPYVSPGLADDLRGLPEAFVFTAGGDSLRDDGAMFVYRLKEAGVKATWLDIKETFHGATMLADGPLGTEKGRMANEAIVKFLKETLQFKSPDVV